MTKTDKLESKLLDLKCVNYNMYIGSGSQSCDKCLEFDDAVEELKQFISQTIDQVRQDTLKEVLEEVEGKRNYKCNHSTTKAFNEENEEGYNQALDQLSQIIKEKHEL